LHPGSIPGEASTLSISVILNGRDLPAKRTACVFAGHLGQRPSLIPLVPEEASMLDYAKARRMMVDSQLRTFDVNDLALLEAFDELPRECFVPPAREGLAYMDQDIPVSDEREPSNQRFMLAPMVLGRMIQALEAAPGANMLDVACGLGYSSALLARLGCSVLAVESDEVLADEARRCLARCGVEGVTAVVGPLDRGYPEAAPYDGILVNGSLEVRPDGLLHQLRDGGRLVCVQGTGRAAKAMLYVRAGTAFGSRALFDSAAPALGAFRAEPGFVF
jgi:protein-L-isoaspartate(D-aspartate) O-methyltransferase